jgi:ATP-independent RNA helicase DbpA
MTDATTFATLDLKRPLLDNLGDLGFATMTLVQASTLPDILAGRDVLARAKTGSGKTAAFGLGLLNALDLSAYKTQALVLCPTRELADQVAGEIRRLARALPNVKILSVCGGAPFGAQTASLRHSPHILVGTPGRILKHLGKSTLDLRNLQTLVLDEADRMLDMGFTEELDAILAYVPVQRQTLLFSATYPETIADISARVQREPKRVDVTDAEQPAQIRQYWSTVTRENRREELLRALRAWGGDLNLVFCNTKIDCAEIASFLRAKNVAAVALHGDLDQAQRSRVLVQFANRSASVLIATDVAARGLDVEDLDVVINYELPPQPDVYIHRIGRTGRAGKAGVAISLIEDRELHRLHDIEIANPDLVVKQRPISDSEKSKDVLKPAMKTILISGGRKHRLRPGDVLGTLTADGGVPGSAVGSIDVFDVCCYVAVENAVATRALRQLSSRPVKGRKYKARICK